MFSSYQADVVQIEVDSDGMRVDLLEETLERLEQDGKRPKFIYTVPNFQNPAGVTMPLEKAPPPRGDPCERELLVLEDNPYGLLRREAGSAPRWGALDEGVYTMYLGTFSKILSPHPGSGSAGWWPRRCVLEKINLRSRPPTSASTLSQLMVEAYFAEGRWGDYVDSLTEIYRARQDTMLDALAEFLPPEADWTRPSGGPLFIWVTLPDYIDTTPTCLRERCARTWRSCPARAPISTAADAARYGSTSPAWTGTPSGRNSKRIGKVVDQQVALCRDACRALLRRRAAASRRRGRGAHWPGGRRAPAATRRRTSGGRRSTSFHAVLRVVREPSAACEPGPRAATSFDA